MSNIFDNPEVLARIDKLISCVKEEDGKILTYEDVLRSISKLSTSCSCDFCEICGTINGDPGEQPTHCSDQKTCSEDTIITIVCGGEKVDNYEEILKKAQRDAAEKLARERQKAQDTQEEQKAPHSSDLMVEKPPHYTSGAIECIDAIAAAVETLQGIEAFDTANAIKYLWRWKRKNGKQDLEKARWYVNHLIAHLEKEKEKENE